MKKMNKVLALLTVMAMLATLFVAVPASATIQDAMTGQHPTVNIHFTSGNTPDSASIDPSTAAVGTVYYAWVDQGNWTPGPYVKQSLAYMTYDKTVEVPYNITGKKAATTAATAKRGFAWADLAQYSEADMTGFYQTTSLYADLDNAFVGAWLDVHSTLQSAINGDEDLGDYTEDTFYQIPASGEYSAFGFAFIKTAEGPSGITIANDDPTFTKTLNGKTILFSTDLTMGQASIATLVDMPTTYREVHGASMADYSLLGTGDVAGKFTDISPQDSAAPGTEEPTDPTGDDVSGTPQASKSADAPNAFFYEFATPVIPGDVTGLTATFQIDGKEAVYGHAEINLQGISNVALEIAAVVMNIPEGQEDTDVITRYVLTYTVDATEKTLEWTRTNKLSDLKSE